MTSPSLIIAFYATAASAVLCSQASVPATPVLCGGHVDVMLVADASSSVADIHDEVNLFIETLAHKLTLDAANPASPRMGLVTFNGPPIGQLEAFLESEASQLVFSLTASASLITTALADRSESTGTTCISCGLLRAQQHLSQVKRSSAQGVVILLTDGAQTVGGDDQTAIQYANRLVEDGHILITIGFGEASRSIMEEMASKPTATYALDAYRQTSEWPKHTLHLEPRRVVKLD